MKKLIFILFLFISSFSITQEKLTRILFILDASNSMHANFGQETRFVVAKRLLTKSIEELRGVENLEIALRVYGHQSIVTATYQDCNDTKLEVPFAKQNHDQIIRKIRTLQAKGCTPIARSLEAAASDFPDANAKNIIILITDGLESCDRDPCVIARKLKEKGVNVKPFVIGLGLDLSYLSKFNCIGETDGANDPNTFKKVLEKVVTKALTNTTVQFNLNNIKHQAKETNVTMFLYKSGSNELKYTFTHTMNQLGLPDTLVLDPSIEYDLIVNTIPQKRLNNIQLKKFSHNIVEVDCPQGYLEVNVLNGNRNYAIPTRVTLTNSSTTLNVQNIDEKHKYIVGKYDLEILTLPRIYKTVDVTQSDVTKISIDAPGKLIYKASKLITGQIFTVNGDNTFTWVCNLNNNPSGGTYFLQPGKYKLVYRFLDVVNTLFTVEKEFTIHSNSTTSLKF